MKKIYTLIAAVAVVLSANAQTKSMSHAGVIGTPYNGALQVRESSALGDTVMYFDGNEFFGNGISSTTFNSVNEDIDNKNVDASLATTAYGPKSAFVFFYELMPTPGDTNVYFSATSWFNPVGAADNWLAFGPISIPAAGANLSWGHVYNDPSYRDGYEILVSTTGLTNYADFTNPPIFTVGNNATSTAMDTAQTPNNVFATRNAGLAAYAGQDIYLAVHHNANDMFIINFDNFLILEGPAGINENGFVNGVKVYQNMPNPFKGITGINYELQNNASVTLSVYDVTGKKVAEQKEGDKHAGKHVVKVNAENLSAGVYYYSLKVNDNTTAAMKMVVIK
jgi:hypothetical protein